jgi:antitoxin CcdA
VELQQRLDAKRAANLSVRADLLDAARAAHLNLSKLLERALADELLRLKWRRWRAENAASIGFYNQQVREQGTFAALRLRL